MEGTPYIEMPIHVTGLFYPIYTENPLTTGSLGAGLVLSPGVRVSVRPGEVRVARLNGMQVNITPLRLLLDQLPPLEVEVETMLPLGVGFSLSAASTLGAALLAGRVIGVKPLEAAQMAHVAEVKALTGLGDVPAIYSGSSLAVRTKPGAPGVGEVESIPVSSKIVAIAASLGHMETQTMLTQYADKINQHGKTAFKAFLKDPSFENFIEKAEWFSEKVGFMNQKTREILKPVKHGLLGAIVKKKVLLTLVDADDAYDVFMHLQRALGRAYYLSVGDAGWRMLLYQEPILGMSRW